MKEQIAPLVYDYVIIGSGFGGSVSAMRLSEKGYSVLVLERGKYYRDQDFAKSNWNILKYIWMPALRCFGILEISLFKDILVLHGSGVGGGSLGYANVLMKPDDKIFANPTWKHLENWKVVLEPFYETATRMLGAVINPKQWPADQVLAQIADERELDNCRPAQVGVFFGKDGEEGMEVPDPYFGGLGPKRKTCNHCGACMVGCRDNAKNTLVKNYLYFAQKWGVKIEAEREAGDVRPLSEGQEDGARYEVLHRSATSWGKKNMQKVRARNVIFSAGTLGTLNLLFRCRDINGSLPKLSARLGDMVRTNSETLLGATGKDRKVDYSQGIAITSILQADEVTAIEPVRYPKGSSLMRFLSSPLIDEQGNFLQHFARTIWRTIRQPMDFIRTHIQPGWAERTTILLVMQTEDNRIRMRLGRGLFTLFRQGLITHTDQENTIPVTVDTGHKITRDFAKKIAGFPAGSVNEGMLAIPLTAHILGGCPFGSNDQEGVIGLDCQIHNYPGLYIVDGSIMPANPGINPSLTITALAEYAMSQVPFKDESKCKDLLGAHPMPELEQPVV